MRRGAKSRLHDHAASGRSVRGTGPMSSVVTVFEGFETFDIPTSYTTIHGVRGGSGPPVLLLHGIPESHLMWHRIAPALAERFTVVATDLRGYGASGKPPSTPDHGPY